MLFLHLFMNRERASGLSPLLAVQGLPLAWWLSRLCAICVSMYMFLSGYGLWYVYRHRSPMGNGRRVFLLYLNVAFIGLLFYPWSACFPRLGWHFDAVGVMSSFSGFNPYNAEWWFLLPWAAICLCSKRLFQLFGRWGWRRSLPAVFLLYLLLRFVVSRCDASLYVFPLRLVYEVMVVGFLLLPFALGAFAAHTGWLAWCRSQRGRGVWWLWLTFVGVALCRIFLIPVGLFDFLVAALACSALSTLGDVALVRRLGQCSMEMWLIHTFFCTYYFPDFFLSLRSPLLMFVVLGAVSYAAARVCQWAFRPVRRWVEGLVETL